MSTFKTQSEYAAHFNSQDEPHSYKPVVHYRSIGAIPSVGSSMMLVPVDHPNLCLNGQIAYTSSVVSFTEDGEIITRNTRYVLVSAK